MTKLSLNESQNYDKSFPQGLRMIDWTVYANLATLASSTKVLTIWNYTGTVMMIITNGGNWHVSIIEYPTHLTPDFIKTCLPFFHSFATVNQFQDQAMWIMAPGMGKLKIALTGLEKGTLDRTPVVQMLNLTIDWWNHLKQKNLWVAKNNILCVKRQATECKKKKIFASYPCDLKLLSRM